MKKSTASKETTEQINTPNRPSNGYELATNGISATNSVEIRPTNGHEILVNGISVDDNTENFQNRSDDDDGEGSSVVIEIVGGVESFIGEAENGIDGGENGVGIIETNGIDDNEMETISYDANIAQDADACCASYSSSFSNHSQGADFLDIDLDAEPDDDQDEVEEDYFDLNAGLIQQQRSESFERNNNPIIENNLSQNEQLCQSYSPPSCVTPQLNDMMEQLPGPSSYCRTADEPEDEGIICQDALAMPVTSCSADCEACIRTDMQIIGVLPTRLENDSAFGSGAGTSSVTYRRRASQFFCVGGPLGKQIAEETFLKISPGPASAENDSCFIMSTEDAKKLNMQIGPSACGATSVSNVLTILKWNHINLEQISYVVSTRTRAVGSPLAEYLLSRSVAGVSHLDLISAMENLTFQQIKGRFFHMYPKRHINISQWLMKWLKKGLSLSNVIFHCGLKANVGLRCRAGVDSQSTARCYSWTTDRRCLASSNGNRRDG